MNILKNIFFEHFSHNYYQSNLGRSYIEYILEKNSIFSGKICFFHFSLDNNRKNSFNNIEILRYIKLFYSNAYIELYPILKFAIKNNIVVSINSFNEYEFIIKFWNENSILRKLLKFLLKKYSNYNIDIEKYSKSNFFEFQVNLRGGLFKIKKFKIYSEIEKSSINNICYKKGYIDKNNIFMLLDIEIINIITFEINYGKLIKLNNPVKFSESEYLMYNYFLNNLENNFDPKKLFLGFVEKTSGEDLIYFTDGYSVKA